MIRRVALSLVLVPSVLPALSVLACSGSSSAPPAAPAQPKLVASAAGATKVTAFAVSNENLNVDSVGMRDGALKPDGSRDHAFTATIEGPFDAVFLVETNQKGEPIYGYRADTMVGGQDLPRELGGVIDTGKMTIGIGVVEGGKFVNTDDGSVSLGAGVHALKLYAPNTSLLAGGDYMRLYVRTGDGTIIASPVAAY